MYKNILESTEHRVYPLPKGPWVMMQKWEHILFVHWPVPADVMERKLPKGLELDTYEGDAWLSIIPFKVSRMRFRNMPQLPYFRTSLEVNVRTYVKRNGVNGVYFFALDTNKLLSALGARTAALPFFHATMAMKTIGDSIHFYSARRTKGQAIFKANYTPIDAPYYPEKESLAHWLLERYFLWTYRNGSLYRGGIHHKPWEIRNAKVQIEKQSLTPFLPWETFGTIPIVHYAPSKVALNWMIRKEPNG